MAIEGVKGLQVVSIRPLYGKGGLVWLKVVYVQYIVTYSRFYRGTCPPTGMAKVGLIGVHVRPRGWLQRAS